MRVRLHEVAHARAGDKGNLNTISLIPYDPAWYPALCAAVTPEAVAAHLADRVAGPVVRHRLDNLAALIFVCPRAPEDTVTTSLHLDAHGKSLSSALLELEVEVPGAPG
ncbi:hypothetical protein ACFPZ0_25825 [Streptomonospora nanhaiensis]|uniref:AtuA-like ferredoxin-fold domain-containing protein n=1 Tax=Streptomonospora nanhaiensis TaxID=1323731 RepID=A0A853BLT6_9ACTN|nr:hypothetical protein [Streptomonospora nanhaiensis]MBV2363294.1 hypothetical protein [Streptomonospora nanhaiensis]MBX9390903.1 hypothetical protein [Streptomonospora nanhaiensis]NYI95654.1 hypothetical protein [Streptomonospora nanhaiensis]